MIKIPFGFLPGHWGLKGKVREEAKIYYEIKDPKEQEISIAKLHIEDPKELNLKILEIKKKYNEISDYEYEIEKLKIIYEGKENNTEYELKKNEIDYKFGKISQYEYEIVKSELNEEPWIKIHSEIFVDESNKIRLALNFEWNKYFINYLYKLGYKDLKQENMVERWFIDTIINEYEIGNSEIDDDLSEPKMLKNIKLSAPKILKKINKVDKSENRSEYF